METQPITKFRWFWAWQDEKEEAWLEEMSRQGLHLAGFRLPGVYRFIQGRPRTIAYRLDYRTNLKKEDKQYFQLFADSGWEYIGSMSSWLYFRKEYAPGEVPEIFTDNASKIEKYKRVLTYLVIFLPLYSVILFGSGRVPRILMGSILLLFVIAIINLIRRINQLKES